jgi:succinate dehydrogenase/fumarate reductase cytochrome b subunit
VILWVTLMLTLLMSDRNQLESAREIPVKAWLRISHGATALIVLLGFLIFHLINHLGALWSVELHNGISRILRLWYQSPWVEPLLFMFICLTLVSGGALMIHYTRFQNNVYRTLQIAGGTYLLAFFGSHVPTVLKARSSNVETDWFFAVSQNGLLDDSRSFLTPYYILAVIALVIHLCMGLRVVMLAHNVEEVTVDRVFKSVMGIGILAATLITGAMFDVHISSLFQR